MSLLRDAVASRGLEDTNVPISSNTILDWLSQRVGGATKAGKNITEKNAIRMVAVYRAAAILSGTMAGLPFKGFKDGTRDEVPNDLMKDPHPDMTPFEVKEVMGVHLALWGNTYWQKRRNGLNEIVELWPVFPDRVSVDRLTPSEANPSGKWFTIQTSKRDTKGQLKADGREVVLSPDDIFHVPGLGYDGVKGLSPIQLAREAIAAGLSAEEFANRLWASGGMVSGVLQTAQKLDREKAEDLRRRINEKMTGLENAHQIAVLDAGAEFKQVSLPPQDAQFIETRRFQVTEIARLYGIPPHLLGEVDRSTSWGTGIEHQNTGYVMFALSPGYLMRVESRWTKELMPEGEYAEFQVQGLMRGDNKARATFYQAMWNMKALTSDEIRERENMPPLTDEQKAEQAEQEPVAVPPTTTQDDDE